MISLAATAVYLGGVVWTIAQIAGLPGRLNGEFWRSFGGLYGRGHGGGAARRRAGFAIATLGRHTSAALGAVGRVPVVWELGARLVLEIVDEGGPAGPVDALQLPGRVADR